MSDFQKSNLRQVVMNLLGLKEEFTDLKEGYTTLHLLKQIKEILDDYEKNTLKPALFKLAEAKGYQDEKGSYIVQFEDGTGWKKEARHSIKVNKEKAVAVFKQKGLVEYIVKQTKVKEDADVEIIASFVPPNLKEKFFEEVEDVPEEYIEQAVLSDQLSHDELAEIVDRKTVYALVEIKPKDSRKK